MNIKYLFFLISIFLGLLSCNKKQTNLEFDQAVMYEIFPALIDSLHFDSRLLPPPPLKLIYDENEKVIGIDTIEKAKAFALYRNRKEELKADSVKLVIAIKDSTYVLNNKNKKELIKHFADQNLSLDKSFIDTNFKIELNKLKANKKFQFKYYSDFPADRSIWRKKYDFEFSGIIDFSRVQFDSSKNFGVFTSGFTYGILNGRGGKVFIKKEKGKWIIHKIVSSEKS